MDQTQESTIAWLRLSRVKGLGPVTGARLLEAFTSPQGIFSASSDRLSGIKGVGPSLLSSIADPSNLDLARQDLDRCNELGVKVLALGHPSYPEPLLRIADPPLVLFVRGDYLAGDANAVAMVGCRNPDPYGESAAVSLAAGLARYGFTLVSGMARGIDAIAQGSALKAGGRSIAVLGTGVDVIYPREHEKLYGSIIERGAVISEFPPGTRPEAGNFPRRNRIISGLSLGVVMVQAMSKKSGALITVRHALDQDREVYAVPGNVGSRSGRVGNALIKEGARLVETAEDVVMDLRPLGEAIQAASDEEPAPPRGPDLPGHQARIYALIPSPAEGAIEVDALYRQSGVPAGEASSALLELELAGLVRCLPGKRYVRLTEL